MYCNLDELVFIMFAVVCGLAAWRLAGLILKGIGRLVIRCSAKLLRKQLKQIEIEKAVEAAERKEG